jgi:TonB-linked SusC/RagA family outer membrane protein
MRNVLLTLTLCLALGFSAIAQIVVTGRVTGDDGITLPGVAILERGTTHGTVTNMEGSFSIRVPANATLIFSFMGFTTQEVAVDGRNIINVTLAPSVLVMDEVVVTALGMTRERKALGYAMRSIEAADLTRASPTNFASALYGLAPGLRIGSAPGGATSAVNINIRGVNSITGRSQPLIVINGIPMRDGEVNNDNFWEDQRIRGNGLLDINPEDIESISILKGASAAALYGSAAVNGVVLITTRSGRGVRGVQVDINSSFAVDNVAYLPRFQNVRGPGGPTWVSNQGQDADMWLHWDSDGDGINDIRRVMAGTVNFGPRFDGQPVIGWDGIIRPYEAQINNFNAIYQPAITAATTVAVSFGGDHGNTRLSLTRQDNEGITILSKNERNILNLNSTFNIGRRVRTDLHINFINQTTRNRPFSTDRTVNNFTGMLSRFDNSEWYLDRINTSLGYRFVTGTGQSLTPDENIRISGFRGDFADYVWTLHNRQSQEFSNRLIANLANTWQILDNLSLRSRIATDYTAERSNEFERNPIPLEFGNSGWFNMGTFNSNILYGDVLLAFNQRLTPDLLFTATAGYTAQRDEFFTLRRSTAGGLSTRDLFDIAASVDIPTSSSSRRFLVQDAFLGKINFDYRGFLFAEGTLRRDRTSTMHPDQNAFIYPSVNTSFVFSEAFEMPDLINFGKLRASWGVVGNYPDIYSANIAFNQSTLGVQQPGGRAVLFTTLPMAFGNDGIKPEEKREFELGLELVTLNYRLRFDVAYYDGRIVDQILPLSLPSSTGATSVLTNIGTLRNRGIEFSVNATPVQTNNFRWNAIFNVSNNVNTIEKLAGGEDVLLHRDIDGSAAQIRSVVGRPMGDIYVRPLLLIDGQPVVDQTRGLYLTDGNSWVRAGNAMPKAVGGLINSFSFRNWSVDAVIDFRYGGHVMPTGINWMIGRGLTEESLQWMDTESGGLSYFVQGTQRILITPTTVVPPGTRVFHDGILLPGVAPDGTPNTRLATNPEYFWLTYNWGGPQFNPWARYELFVQENNFVKLRNLTLSYTLPQALTQRLGIDRIQLSLFGRNLFFFYRTLKHLDPEQLTAGSRWQQQITHSGTNPATRTFGGSIRVSL